MFSDPKILCKDFPSISRKVLQIRKY